MLWVYRLLFFPALAVMAPYYLWRMRRRGGYREGMRERFGKVPALPPKRPGVRRVWLQAVSVGEMLAVGPLIDGLLADGGNEIYLTTTTSTGRALAKEKYGAKVLAVANFPTDAWVFSARAWGKIQPDLVLLTEGERWPEHLAQARRRGVPVVAVNARLSDRSYGRMHAWRGVLASLWRGYTAVLAASAADAERFIALGFAPQLVTVTGNLKLDLSVRQLTSEERTELRAQLGLGGGRILLGSSTWPGEEALLLAAFAEVRRQDPAARLLLVPRHAERREEVNTLLVSQSWSYHFRSRGPAAAEVDVAVGDTTGELRAFTQLADLVVVGKSFPPHGEGQTPVEAAALGRAIVVGPGMSNFKTIVSDLRARGAVRQVPAAELAPTLAALWHDRAECERMGRAAEAWQVANRGALARTLEAIRRVRP